MLAADATGAAGEAEDVGAGRGGRPGCRGRHRRRGRRCPVPTQATPAAQEPPANTAKVEQGELSAMVSLDGTLTYRARSDGSPYSAINQARGIYTELPDEGDKVDCGDVLYRVDDDPVLLLCGTVPAYRDLAHRRRGQGRPSAQPEPARSATSRRRRLHLARRRQALEKLQHDKGLDATGALDLDDAVFLPKSVRIAKVTGELGGSARPGATGRAGHIRHARGAGGPRGVAAG